MRHILSVTVENEPGVLSRVAGLFSGRGFNIESLNVGPTLDPGVSVMTIATDGDEQIIEQIVKQLRKLITVIKVVDLTDLKSVLRELVLLKVNANDTNRAEILRIVDIFRCKVVDVSIDELSIEATGNHEKISAILGLLTRFGIKEISRSGMVSMKRSIQA